MPNPNRFYLGTTTPREMHDLLWRLANKTLLSPESCTFLLSITRWINGYMDGVRRVMSSDERSRVATKYGADFNTLGASRHEAGFMFGTDGLPKLTYAMFAEGLGDLDNYGSTTRPCRRDFRVVFRLGGFWFGVRNPFCFTPGWACAHLARCAVSGLCPFQGKSRRSRCPIAPG